MDIVDAIVDNMAARCGCSFTEDRITHRVFQCFPSSPDTVTYHALLHGTLQANVSYLLTVLQEWASSVNTVAVQFLPLSVESFCTVTSSSPVELCPGDVIPLPTTAPITPRMSTSEITESESTVLGENVATSNPAGVIGAVVAVVIVVMLLALVFIVVAVVVLRRRHRRADISTNPNCVSERDVQLTKR